MRIVHLLLSYLGDLGEGVTEQGESSGGFLEVGSDLGLELRFEQRLLLSELDPQVVNRVQLIRNRQQLRHPRVSTRFDRVLHAFKQDPSLRPLSLLLSPVVDVPKKNSHICLCHNISLR